MCDNDPHSSPVRDVGIAELVRAQFYNFYSFSFHTKEYKQRLGRRLTPWLLS